MALQQAGKSTSKGAPPAPPKPQRISMNPDNFVPGGAGINDIDVTITDAQATTFDWAGQAPPDTPALALEFTDRNGGTHVEYLSLGKAEDWQPEESGEGFIAVSTKLAIVDDTNLGKFLKSMVGCDFPKELLEDGSFKNIIGTDMHVIREAVKRSGLVRTGKNAARDYQVLLCQKIHSLPGSGTSKPKPATGKPSTAVQSKTLSGKANGQATTPPSADDTLAQHIYTALQLHLGEAGEPIPVKAMPKVAFDYFKAEGLEGGNKAVALCNKQSFRASLADNGIVYDSDAGTVALAE